MKRKSVLRLVVPAALALLPHVASAQLSNYWPINESSGTTTANTVGGGSIGTLNGTAAFVNDPTRGQVLNFDGSAGAYVDAGILPLVGVNSNFTWSTWANNAVNLPAGNSRVIMGNRFNTSGGDFSPLEFTKFTNQGFEFYHGGSGGDNIGYTSAIPINNWVHLAVVKQGPLIFSYRNGVISGMSYINQGQSNVQPLYFGGDKGGGGGENWTGKLDDISTYSSALPNSSIVALAKGATPTSVPLSGVAPSLTTTFSENFASAASITNNWNVTTRGLEQSTASTYNAPSVNGSGQLVLGGTTNNQYWYGSSLESKQSFDSTKLSEISLDRVSLSGTGIFRSSLWILGDNGHYLHFAQNVNEGGWQFNYNDVGGEGSAQATGGGVNIEASDALDGELSLHTMKIRMEPTGDPGDVNMFMYLDGSLVAAQGFSNFTSTFQVALTGQARATNDTVSATFDNVLVAQVPEPGSAALLLAGSAFLLRRRRK
jgi:hypothetical protein